MTNGFEQLLNAAATDASVRGRLIWFPDQIIAEYGLTAAEAQAVEGGDISELVIEDDELRQKAELVFDLHDLHSGE